MGRIYLDFETKSELDLKDVGAFKYAEHPSTDVLLLAYSTSEHKVNLWEPSMLKYKPLWDLVNDPETRLYAWNATFDLLIWEHVMHRRYGWPQLPDRIWFDVMAVSCYRSYPAALEKAAPALGVTAKAEGGTRLINFFSKPTVNEQGRSFHDPLDHPTQYEAFRHYAKMDVVSCHYAHKKLGDLPPDERKLWLHTLQINKRGVNVDTGLCRSVVYHIDKKREQLNDLITVHTGGEVTRITQRERVKNFIFENYGFPVDNMQGDYLKGCIDRAKATIKESKRDSVIGDLNKVITVLTWYLQGGKSSTAKYNKILTQVCDDGTVKGFLFYHGAGTGGYSGRGVQFQNFPNKVVDNAEEVAEVIADRDTQLVELVIGELFDLTKKLLRATVIAPAGKHLCVGDYSSIEMVGSAWAAREKTILDAFDKGLDQYRLQAAAMFDKPYGAVTKDERQAGKIVVLACGFGGHAQAVLNMAAKYGMAMSHSDATKLANQFRYARPQLVDAWKDIEATMGSAIVGKEGKIWPVPKVRGMALVKLGDDLRILLPSGREINYPQAVSLTEMVTRTVFDHKKDKFIDYKEVKSVSTRWSDKGQWAKRELYGSLLFQNYVQGLCRDILAEGQLRLEEAGSPICINVHDELGALVTDDSEYTLNKFLSVMTRRPKWLPKDFPLKADGYISKRYKK